MILVKSFLIIFMLLIMAFLYRKFNPIKKENETNTNIYTDFINRDRVEGFEDEKKPSQTQAEREQKAKAAQQAQKQTPQAQQAPQAPQAPHAQQAPQAQQAQAAQASTPNSKKDISNLDEQLKEILNLKQQMNEINESFKNNK